MTMNISGASTASNSSANVGDDNNAGGENAFGQMLAVSIPGPPSPGAITASSTGNTEADAGAAADMVPRPVDPTPGSLANIYDPETLANILMGKVAGNAPTPDIQQAAWGPRGQSGH
jgi:hypothetical protein